VRERIYIFVESEERGVRDRGGGRRERVSKTCCTRPRRTERACDMR